MNLAVTLDTARAHINYVSLIISTPFFYLERKEPFSTQLIHFYDCCENVQGVLIVITPFIIGGPRSAVTDSALIGDQVVLVTVTMAQLLPNICKMFITA